MGQCLPCDHLYFVVLHYLVNVQPQTQTAGSTFTCFLSGVAPNCVAYRRRLSSQKKKQIQGGVFSTRPLVGPRKQEASEKRQMLFHANLLFAPTQVGVVLDNLVLSTCPSGFWDPKTEAGSGLTDSMIPLPFGSRRGAHALADSSDRNQRTA